MATTLTRLLTRHSRLRSLPLNRLHFSSEPEPQSETPRRQPSASPPIQPISYAHAPKPKPDPEPNPSPTLSERFPRSTRETPQPSRQVRPARAAWTREGIRYVKDAPSISPVSYPTRVVPVPEDKPVTEETVKEDGEVRNRRRLRVFEIEREDPREKMKVPFPTLIRQVKKERKPVYDWERPSASSRWFSWG